METEGKAWSLDSEHSTDVMQKEGTGLESQHVNISKNPLGPVWRSRSLGRRYCIAPWLPRSKYLRNSSLKYWYAEFQTSGAEPKSL